MAIKEEDVAVGREYEYPHHSGFGMSWTTVVRIIEPRRVNSKRRVQHESRGTGWGATVDMDVFIAHARPSKR